MSAHLCLEGSASSKEAQIRCREGFRKLLEKPVDQIQDALAHATRDCPKPYAKGKRSFEILAQLEPKTLEKHLPSFVRLRRILDQRL